MHSVHCKAAMTGLIGLALLAPPDPALADAGGLSFWLPGAFGSLAAAPGVPGWSYATIYLHLQSSGGRGANFVLPGGGRGAVAVGLTDHAERWSRASPTLSRSRCSAARPPSPCSVRRATSASASAPH